jgi:hypothetical protein
MQAAANPKPERNSWLSADSATGSKRHCRLRRAVVSPFVSPRARKRRPRAKAPRNHNPRVGGSSPSSGMRSACKSALSAQGGDAEYIPRVRAQWPPDSAVCRGVVSASLTFQSPGQSPGGPTQRAGAGDPPTAGPRPRKVPRSPCSGAAPAERGVETCSLSSSSSSLNLSSCCSSKPCVSSRRSRDACSSRQAAVARTSQEGRGRVWA